MNNQDEKVRSDQDPEPASARSKSVIGPSYRETTEIEGWALHWDTSALRKANLAMKMRSLRKAAGNQ